MFNNSCSFRLVFHSYGSMARTFWMSVKLKRNYFVLFHMGLGKKTSHKMNGHCFWLFSEPLFIFMHASTNGDIDSGYYRTVISILANTTLTEINHFNPGMLTESAIICKTRSLMSVNLFSFSDWPWSTGRFRMNSINFSVAYDIENYYM